jgi:5'-nucleotidase
MAVLGILLLFAGVALAGEKHITFVSINDMHGHIFPYTVSVTVDGEKQKAEVGGLGRFATVVNEEELANPGNLFVTNAGDINEGPLFYFFHGGAETTGLNQAGVEIATLGNHEFDLGEAILLEAMSKANYPFVVSNLVPREGELPENMLATHTMTAENGTKVGFFGLLPGELHAVTGGAERFDVRQDFPEVAREMVKALRDQGCHVVVALSHIGYGEDLRLAENVGGIDLILGGHSHTAVQDKVLAEGPQGWKTLVTQAGAMGRYAGVVHLVLEKDAVNLEKSTWELRELTASIPQDPRVVQALLPFQEKIEEELGKPFSTLTVDADARKAVVRAQESALGNVLADALRWKAKSRIAVLNGGGIRGDKVYPAGDLSYRTLYEIFPYGNTLSMVDLKGSDIREILEISASALVGPEDDYDSALRTPTGGFLQLSGLKVVYDLTAEPALIDNDNVRQREGKRLVSAEVLQEDGTWLPLRDDEVYSVATMNWTSGGGDKFYVFGERKKEGAEYDSRVMDVEVIAEYVREQGGLTPYLDNRIILQGK